MYLGELRTRRTALLAFLRLREAPAACTYLRCAECGTVVEAAGRLRRPAKRQQLPLEWACPACGSEGPLAIGEQLPNDAVVRCRRRWVCRHTFTAPATVWFVVCPRCGTKQPARSSIA